jgi:hypothetical protein
MRGPGSSGDDVNELRLNYPAIDSVVGQFCEVPRSVHPASSRSADCRYIELLQEMAYAAELRERCSFDLHLMRDCRRTPSRGQAFRPVVSETQMS